LPSALTPVLIGIGVCLATPVAAHQFAPGLLALEEGAPSVFGVRWQPPGSVPDTDAPLRPEFPAHCRVVAAGDSVRLPETANGETWRIDCGRRGLAGHSLAVAGLSVVRSEVVVRARWRDGRITTAVLHHGAPDVTLPSPAAAAPRVAVLLRYTRLGTEHILLGFDHLLFVAALLQLLRCRRTMLAAISAFTVGHSVTLAVATLGTTPLSPHVAEVLIAGSIVLLAREIAAPGGGSTLIQRRPWAASLLFGFLHGLGFAGALAAYGVPAEQAASALLAFNLGVEIGQLLFVAGLLLLRRVPRLVWTRAGHRALAEIAAAYGIGGLAFAWALQRLAALAAP
jgi:hypothetical protein